MKPLQFGITGPISWLTILAKEKDMFLDRDLSIRFRTFLAGKKAMQALRKGWVDIANVIDANVASLATEKKVNVRLLACTQTREDGRILARADADIYQPSDFYGERLAYMPGTSSHMFIVYFAKHHRLNIEKLNLVPVRMDRMEQALLSGDVDACSVWQPFSFQIQQAASRQNIELVNFPNEGFFRYFIMLAAHEKTLQKRRQEIDTVIDVLKQAAQFAKENRDQTNRILSQAVDMPLPIFETLEPDVAFNILPIADEFWRQVAIQTSWLTQKPVTNIDQLVDKLSVSH
ncbi:MAG: ABC transporter substrate-binding protein [Gammaproteobacteria bacterium]|nr:ABC transporter substrate-binding protein [Gammaproteobacteria bacterium]